jgi:hypothetical protein
MARLQIKPPEFSGDVTSLSFAQWKRDITEYITYAKWDRDTCISSLPLLLSGRARQVYQDLPATSRSTWETALEELGRVFGIDPTSDLLSLQRLERVQREGESVHKYAKDLMQRHRDVGVSDEPQIMRAFYRGLLPKLKREIFLLKSDNLAELEKNATLIEMNLRENGDVRVEVVDEAIKRVTEAVTRQIYAIQPQSVPPPQSSDNPPSPQRNPQEKPFCKGCGEAHPWRQHTQPPFCVHCQVRHKFGQHINAGQKPPPFADRGPTPQ